MTVTETYGAIWGNSGSNRQRQVNAVLLSLYTTVLTTAADQAMYSQSFERILASGRNSLTGTPERGKRLNREQMIDLIVREAEAHIDSYIALERDGHA